MILDLVLYGDPVLRKKAVPVKQFDENLKVLCQDMIETMEHYHGIGIAAPQIGSSLRIFIANLNPTQIEESTPKKFLIAINPKITLLTEAGTAVEQEGCLSIPGLYASVKRYNKVLLEAFDPAGKPLKIQAEGLLARIFQHENDHLDGILFTDKVLAGEKKSVEQSLKDFKGSHA